MKKLYDTGAVFMLIAVLFAASAIYKTITSDPIVIALQWFCAAGFALAALLQIRKMRSS